MAQKAQTYAAIFGNAVSHKIARAQIVNGGGVLLRHGFAKPVNRLHVIALYGFALVVNFSERVLRLGVARESKGGKFVEMNPKRSRCEFAAVFVLSRGVFSYELAFRLNSLSRNSYGAFSGSDLSEYSLYSFSYALFISSLVAHIKSPSVP